MTPNMPTGETMSEGSAEEMSEGIQAPVSSLGGAKVGGTVSLKVESIDEESGMATLSPAAMKASPNVNPEQSTINKAAALYDEEGGE